MANSASAKDTMEGVSRAAADVGNSVIQGIGQGFDDIANKAKDTLSEVGLLKKQTSITCLGSGLAV